MGYDGVELMVLDPAKLDAGEVRSKAQAAGLAIAAIASGAQAGVGRLTLLAADQATRAEAATRLRQLVDFAAAVGAPLVTIGGFRGRLAAAGDGRGPSWWRHCRPGRTTPRPKTCAWSWNRSIGTRQT